MDTQNRTVPVVEFKAGETIFQQGDPGEHTYLIRSGKISIYTISDGQKVRRNLLKAGNILGEMAVITGEPRSASAEAVTDCELLQLDEKALRVALAKSPPVIRAVLAELIRRIKGKEEGMSGSLEDEADMPRVIKLERALVTIRKTASAGIADRDVQEEGLVALLEGIVAFCDSALSNR